MALVIANRVQETTTTTGTGTVTLAGAVAGFQSFAIVGDTNTTYYTITSGNNWEVGIGTYASSGTTLARTTILSSSNANAAITLAGTSTVFSSYPAEKVISDGYGLLPPANGGTGLSSPGTVGNVLTSTGTVWVSQLPSAAGITYTTVKTSNYTAVANDGVQTNTSGGAFTVTLPATPATGAQVIVTDSGGTWATTNLTVGRNGSTIDGVASDLTCDISNVSVQFVYSGTTWDVFAQVGGASGGVAGPASSTDNAITRFDSTTGKLIQNSLVTVADDGAITAPQVGSMIPFYYANQAAFPSASTSHGALAHSHADGAMYFAHGGAWYRLLDASTTVTVAQGGTGATTLTGYVKGTGTTAMTASAAIPTSDLSGTLTVANGGTGANTLAANNVLLGNGTSAFQVVAPSTNGNVLVSNGTTWVSQAPAASGLTRAQVTAISMILGF